MFVFGYDYVGSTAEPSKTWTEEASLDLRSSGRVNGVYDGSRHSERGLDLADEYKAKGSHCDVTHREPLHELNARIMDELSSDIHIDVIRARPPIHDLKFSISEIGIIH